MNIQGLPANVQRRIALLLQAPADAATEGPDAQPGAEATAPDHTWSVAKATDGDRPGSHVDSCRDRVNTLAQRLQPPRSCVVDTRFRGTQHLQAARLEAQEALQQGRQASLGGGKPLLKWESNQARGDQMIWLKRQEQLDAGHQALVGIMDALLQLQQALARGWDVEGPPSFQLAMYPGNAARYVRHADASPSSPARSITAIYYLNPDWDDKLNGGKLCLYHRSTADAGSLQGEQATLIAPAADTLVVFDSRLEHEVLPTFADRCAITVWFSRAQKQSSQDKPAARDAAHEEPRPTSASPSSQVRQANLAPMPKAQQQNNSPVSVHSSQAQQRPVSLSLPLASEEPSLSTGFLTQKPAEGPRRPVAALGAVTHDVQKAPAAPSQSDAGCISSTSSNNQSSQEGACQRCKASPTQDRELMQPNHSNNSGCANYSDAQHPTANDQDRLTHQGMGHSNQTHSGNSLQSQSSTTQQTQLGHSRPTQSSNSQQTQLGNSQQTPSGTSQQKAYDGSLSTVLAAQQRRVTKPGHIFVSIAAYRDPECQWTLCDLLKQADEPNLVTAGVVWQIDAVEDAAFVRVAGADKRLSQMREIRVPWQEATGPCKARHLAQQLWAGEEFCLQTDSHMRFVPGWDTRLKQMLQQAEAASAFGKAVISSYPPAYEGEGASASLPPSLDPTVMEGQGWDQEGMVRLVARTVPAGEEVGVLAGRFWAAGFSFSHSQLFAEVPYDPNLPFLFFGEEMGMLARMWTRGWDVMAPNQAVVFHLWSRAYRHTFQADIAPDQTAKLASQAKIKQLLANDPSKSAVHGPQFSKDTDFGLGQLRSIQDFWHHCGMHQFSIVPEAVDLRGFAKYKA